MEHHIRKYNLLVMFSNTCNINPLPGVLWSRILTVASDWLKYPKLSQGFQTITGILPSSEQLPGITHNLSQNLAFIKDPSWSDSQEDDQMEMIFFFHPGFAGQKDTLFLKDLITDKGVDGDRLGIFVEFLRERITFTASWTDES